MSLIDNNRNSAKSTTFWNGSNLKHMIVIDLGKEVLASPVVYTKKIYPFESGES